jgi:hypothetical protein
MKLVALCREKVYLEFHLIMIFQFLPQQQAKSTRNQNEGDRLCKACIKGREIF